MYMYLVSDVYCMYVRIYMYNYIMYMDMTGSGKIQRFADSVKIEILLYLASIMSE